MTLVLWEAILKMTSETKQNKTKTKQNAEKDVVGKPFNVVTTGAIMSVIERRKF